MRVPGRRTRRTVRRPLAGAVLLALPEAARACEHCFGAGAVDTPVTQGIGLAMLSLMVMTGVVMVGIVAFFVNMQKRTRLLAPGATVVTEDGEIVPSDELG